MTHKRYAIHRYTANSGTERFVHLRQSVPPRSADDRIASSKQLEATIVDNPSSSGLSRFIVYAY